MATSKKVGNNDGFETASKRKWFTVGRKARLGYRENLKNEGVIHNGMREGGKR